MSIRDKAAVENQRDLQAVQMQLTHDRLSIWDIIPAEWLSVMLQNKMPSPVSISLRFVCHQQHLLCWLLFKSQKFFSLYRLPSINHLRTRVVPIERSNNPPLCIRSHAFLLGRGGHGENNTTPRVRNGEVERGICLLCAGKTEYYGLLLGIIMMLLAVSCLMIIWLHRWRRSVGR